MAAAGTHRFGHYEILSLLGRGGMSEVYRARAVEGPRAGQQVAIKRLLPELSSSQEYVDLFCSEADVSRLLSHPNIVKVYEVGVLQDVYFIVMELVDGRDVGQIVRRCQQRGIAWPIDFAVYAVRVLLEALSYAHNVAGPNGKPLSIVHCDISPSNLFVSRTGDIRLGDFGVARGRVAGLAEPTMLGKPHYYSPEAFAGEITPAVDLWAATVTLFELLTERRPFPGNTTQEVRQAIERRAADCGVRGLRAEVTPGLAAVLDKGFARRPEDRFQTAAEFAQALIEHYDERVGTPLAISAMVRGLFGVGDGAGKK